MRIFRYLRYKLWDESRGMGKPVPKAVFDRDYASGKWDFLGSGEEAMRLNALADLVCSRWQHPAIFDVGSGAGLFASALASAEPESYLGIDLSDEAVERASKLALAGTRFEAANFETCAVPMGRTFDVICFIESIGYATDPRATLRRFTGCLRKNGGILVSLYRSGNSASIWSRIAKDYVFSYEKMLRGDGGKSWDVRILAPKPGVSG